MLGKSDIVGITLVLAISLILIVPSATFPSVTAEENDEEVEVPEWYEGDSWQYEVRETLAEGFTAITRVEKEVITEKVNYQFDIQEAGEETYESYEVMEKHIPQEDEDELEEIEGAFGYTRDTLSPIMTHPHGQVRSFYYPPLRELDFPFSIGDHWTYEEGYFLEEQTDGPAEPTRHIIRYEGRVEERVTRHVNGRAFDSYMVNFTILAEDLDADEYPLEWRRQEIYFSPEVKNVIHRDFYETRNLPEDEGREEAFAREENLGNETLLDFTHVEPQEDDDQEASLLGVGVVLVIIGVTTASFYVYKKLKGTV